MKPVHNDWNIRNTSHQQEVVANLSMPHETSRDTHTRNSGVRKKEKVYKVYDKRFIRTLTWSDISGRNRIWFRDQQEGVHVYARVSDFRSRGPAFKTWPISFIPRCWIT